MPEAYDEAAADRRATWVALRTLQQRPTFVRRTGQGEAVYEVQSAQLVLVGDSPCFNRLLRCSACGRDLAGEAVLGPADLSQPAPAVVCTDCAQAPAPALALAPEPVSDIRALVVPSDPLPPLALPDGRAELSVGSEILSAGPEMAVQEGLSELRADMTAEIDHRVGALAERLLALDGGLRQDLMAVVRVVQELADARADLEDRLNALLQRADEAEARMAARAAATVAVARDDALDELERQLRLAESRIAGRALPGADST